MDLMPIKTSKCLVSECNETIVLGDGATCTIHKDAGGELIAEWEAGIPCSDEPETIQ